MNKWHVFLCVLSSNLAALEFGGREGTVDWGGVRPKESCECWLDIARVDGLPLRFDRDSGLKAAGERPRGLRPGV